MVHPVEKYLKAVADVRRSGQGVPEMSYYSALRELLQAAGDELTPKVTVIFSLANRGAGLPDGGFFTPDQLRPSPQDEWRGLSPARGVVEVKGVSDDAFLTAEGEQVSGYRRQYKQVLVTNLRAFLLIGADENGNPVQLTPFVLAETAEEFWRKAEKPKETAEVDGEGLFEFLKNALLFSARIEDPKELAYSLAWYALEAKRRVQAADLRTLKLLRDEMESALGLKFEGKKGSQFFQSSLVQTLFYGLFSSWVLWSKGHTSPSDRFDWRTAAWYLHVPMVRTLFDQLAVPETLGDLKLVQVLDWTNTTLNRVNRDIFFQRFKQEQAVQYFYEPFLAEFDLVLRKDLGVWYTPHEVVEYMVARIDQKLRSELGVEDGLADPNVYVLDPCAGTGSFLLEVLRRIAQTYQQKGMGAAVGLLVKKAAQERVFGFEILPAPYVVSHLQLGVLLQELGAPLGEGERVAIYLTNSLTGWQAPDQPQRQLLLQLEREREAAEQVKRHKPILVILGNPPYNSFAGTSPSEEMGLVTAYKEGLSKPAMEHQEYNMDDMYVRFFRIAERRIVQTGRGVICFISNFSYLGAPSFVVMRNRLASEFDSIWFDCMNGDARETGKRTPAGDPDPSVFSTEYNRAGIRVGTVVGMFVRKLVRNASPEVHFRHFWGVHKREDLLASVTSPESAPQYEIVTPTAENWYLFRRQRISEEYRSWPSVAELALSRPLHGPVEMRGGSFIAMSADSRKLGHLADYLDPGKSDEEIASQIPRLMRSSGEFKAEKARRDILANRVRFDATKIIRYTEKPMDVRVAYLDPQLQPLFSRPSPQLVDTAMISDNAFILSRDTADTSPEGPPFYYSAGICDYDCVSGHARHFPLLVKAPRSAQGSQVSLRGDRVPPVGPVLPNLSTQAVAYLKALGVEHLDANSARLLWFHVLAMGFSREYLVENIDGVSHHWPKIPLPRNPELLRESARVGETVARILDGQSSNRITTGDIHPLLRRLGVLTTVAGSDPAPNLGVDADWGRITKGGRVFPGSISQSDALVLLGETTNDVFLNERVFWSNIPANVWEFVVAGYQVLKKWLSYRENAILARPLTTEESVEYTGMVRRVAALLLLERQRDAAYGRLKPTPLIGRRCRNCPNPSLVRTNLRLWLRAAHERLWPTVQSELYAPTAKTAGVATVRESIASRALLAEVVVLQDAWVIYPQAHST